MPVAAESSPSSLDDPPGSLEQIRSSEAYPKCLPQRIPSHPGIDPSPLDSAIDGDDPQVPFPLLPGEALSKFGDLSSTCRIFLSNFRVFVLKREQPPSFHNIPLTCIDTADVREILYLYIFMRDSRCIKVLADNKATCLRWVDELKEARPVKRDASFAFPFFVWCREEKRHLALQLRSLDTYTLPRLAPPEHGTKKASILSLFRRLNFDDSSWRISSLNEDFKLCSSYPEFCIVPRCIEDSQLERSAQYRGLHRFPSLVWRDPLTGAVLLRSSQPGTGLLGWRCSEDEALLNAFAAATPRSSNTPSKAPNTPGSVSEGFANSLLIMDARSYAAGWANRAKGGGYENPDYYQRCEVQFMGLANIHTIRGSFQQLRALFWTYSTDHPAFWLQSLQATQWLQHLSNLMGSAVRVCEGVRGSGRTVLVHCSDGWDRTSQIVSLAKLMLDPFYRTMTGFRELVEGEWVGFGHKFSDRLGIITGSDPNERSPVFLQWLDGVHQLLCQFPTAFQFNHSYLVKLAHHCHSGLFGTFLCNTAKEARLGRIGQTTFSVWAFLHPDNCQFRNVIYEPHQEPLWPRTQVRDLLIWTEMYQDKEGPEESSAFTRHRSGSFQNGGVGASVAGGVSSERNLNRAHSCDSLNSANAESSSAFVRTGSDSNIPSTEPSVLPGVTTTVAPAIVSLKTDGCPDTVLGKVVSDALQPSVEGGPKNGEDKTQGRSPSLGDLNGLTSASRTATKMDAGSSTSPHELLSTRPLEVHFSQQNGYRASASSEEPPSFDMDGAGISDMTANAADGNSRSTSTSDISDSLVQRVFATVAGHGEGPATSSGALRGANGRVMPTVIRPGNEEGTLSLKPIRRRRTRISDWLDTDGLNVLIDPFQDKARSMRQNYLRKIEELENKLQLMRAFRADSRQQNGLPLSVCSRSNSDQASQGDMEPKSGESGGVGSEASWEAVEDGEGQPTRWIPDHAASHCMGCYTEFWTVNRRHHCRACGKVFCSACSSFESPVPGEQLFEPVRVCNFCYDQLRAEAPPSSLSAS